MSYDPRLHVVLYQPEIPYNAGNIGRTCVAVGAKLWMVKPLGFEITDYYLRRAGMDYWPLLEHEVVEDWAELTAKLAGRRFWYFSKKATRRYCDPQYAPGDVLVFGRESSGLPDDILAAAGDTKLRIPMREEVRSLNLSNCAAILLYEALRQWNEFPSE
ncbi:MAG: tRNA (cytidine(34)-2'-O)-methyltransferase [Pirellulales bacterium]